ncbi:biotin/lipoyl-binding protein [Pedobacter sp. FW305-3-2-15-E-R2A2]|uniref:HlyD family secretion protein n=1 Tax=Pedobacter sp. FW305-3-2-15-E-R2A2 TaxID=3140251 RepID=UPI00313FEE37
MMNTSFKSVLFVLILAVSACSKPEKSTEGKIKRETLAFAPKVTGRVLKIYVKEGDFVNEGDTLAMLDVPEVNAKLSQAKGAVKAAGAQRDMAKNGATANQLKQLRAKKSGITEQFKFAEKSFSRAKAMFADSMMTPQAFDEATAKYNGAKAQLTAVNAEYNEAEKGVRPETQTATQGQAEQALGVLQEVQVALSERYIIATNDMQVETISLRVGELATAGYPLFNGYLPQTTYFRFTIPESKIAAYKKGAAIEVTVLYNKEKFKGKIQTVKQLTRYADITAAYPNYDVEEGVYEVKIIPDDQQAAEKLLVNATIIL